jgi:hypothetical protein
MLLSMFVIRRWCVGILSLVDKLMLPVPWKIKHQNFFNVEICGYENKQCCVLIGNSVCVCVCVCVFFFLISHHFTWALLQFLAH